MGMASDTVAPVKGPLGSDWSAYKAKTAAYAGIVGTAISGGISGVSIVTSLFAASKGDVTALQNSLQIFVLSSTGTYVSGLSTVLGVKRLHQLVSGDSPEP